MSSVSMGCGIFALGDSGARLMHAGSCVARVSDVCSVWNAASSVSMALLMMPPLDSATANAGERSIARCDRAVSECDWSQ